jgi:UDP-N-acetylmuramoyl-L-alanine---L-glutamate ligase
VTLDELKTYKRILILGYAAEGKASERFLKKYHPTAEIGIADQKDDPNYLDQQKNYDLAIRTPLLRPKHLTIPYTTGTNLFFGNVRNTIIGVTGTKGKSTTVSLLHHVLKKSGLPVRLHGNIGIPMLDALVDGVDEKDIFILELSNYQLEDITYSPQIACFLNIYEELHNHDSYDEYFGAKSNITLHQKPDDFFYYNGTQSQLVELAERSLAQAHDFSTEGIDLSDMTLPFYTHELNLKAVWAITRHMGISEADFREHVQTYQPLEHRVARVGTFDDICT